MLVTISSMMAWNLNTTRVWGVFLDVNFVFGDEFDYF